MFDCCSTFVGFNLSQSWYFRDPYKIEYRQWNLIYSTFGIVNDILSIDMKNLYLISTHSLPRDVVLCNGDHTAQKHNKLISDLWRITPMFISRTYPFQLIQLHSMNFFKTTHQLHQIILLQWVLHRFFVDCKIKYLMRVAGSTILSHLSIFYYFDC